MPKHAINYANTIIYKLINYDCPENVYVGTTTNRVKRKQAHKAAATNPNHKSHNLKVYKIIRENGGWESWYFVEIKAFPCESRRESEKEEDRIMQELKANMNSIRAFCTVYETQERIKETKHTYNELHNVHNKQKCKEYHINNRKQISQRKKEYRELNGESISKKISIYNQLNKDKIKRQKQEYNKLNHHKIKQNKKIYRELNKVKIKDRQQIKHTCECGSTYCKDGKKKRHEKPKNIRII